MPDCSAVTFWVSSVIGPISPNAYSRKAIRLDTSSSPRPPARRRSPRIDDDRELDAGPGDRPGHRRRPDRRMLCRADVAAARRSARAWRSSARLALTVRMARSAPSSSRRAGPGAPGPLCALAIPGISGANSTATTDQAATVMPSSTRSSTPIRTSVPTSPMTALIRPTRLRGRRLAQQHRVGRDPGDQLAGRPAGHARPPCAEEAADHRRAGVQHDPLGDRAQQDPLSQ